MSINFVESRLVREPIQRVFDVVAKTELYETFIPWCTRSRTIAHAGSNPPQSHYSELTIGFGPFRETFVSKVTTREPEEVLSEALPSHLFESLRSHWQLSAPEPSITTVKLQIEGRFKSNVHSFTANMFMERVTSTILNSFIQRCKGGA